MNYQLLWEIEDLIKAYIKIKISENISREEIKIGKPKEDLLEFIRAIDFLLSGEYIEEINEGVLNPTEAYYKHIKNKIKTDCTK